MSAGWKVRHSLWLLGVVAGIGYFSFLAFGYVAIRTQTRKSVTAAVVSVGCAALLIGFIPDDAAGEDSAAGYGLLALACWAVLVVLAAFVNADYLRWHREELKLSAPPESRNGVDSPPPPDSLSWSPPTSRFQSPKEAAFTGSRLTFHDGVLTWKPNGIRSTAVGGRPFSLPVGAGEGAAQELVWVHGDVADARSRPVRADVFALCARNPTSPGGRKVLAYLPSALVRPYRGVPDVYGDTDEVAEARARAIADAAGLSFATFEPTYGADLGKDFPGAMPGAGFIPVFLYIQAATVIVPGVGALGAAAGIGGHLDTGWRVGLGVAGILMVALGTAVLPPVLRSARRKQRQRT